MRNTKKYELLLLIVQGKVAGRRRPGRRRISWLKNLRQWFGKSTKSLFRAAVSKVEIALMIANLHKETAPQEEEDINE
ncbi:jg10705 [Pararge aegeria aegeria]|uniref:Jg10705 protein n=1 Tax=Pararge aegeria aegeria TaxID=348720 RepID=A0A8S4RI89_9NEOP|nr:jg10705 [Pararge aegeria aegeria]